MSDDHSRRPNLNKLQITFESLHRTTQAFLTRWLPPLVSGCKPTSRPTITDSLSVLSAPQEGPRKLFSTARERVWLGFFILFGCIDVALLGLVSYIIHSHRNESSDYPGAEFYHAIGLLLFVSIFGLLIALSHAYLPLVMVMLALLVTGVMNGTGAGIIEQTPFGHGLQCKNPVDRFPANFQPYVSDCSRYTAIEGLAWALFALSVFGLFFAFADMFELRRRRSVVYESLAEQGHAKAEAKAKAEKEARDAQYAEAERQEKERLHASAATTGGATGAGARAGAAPTTTSTTKAVAPRI